MKTRNINDREDYKDERNTAEAINRAAKEEMWIKTGQDLEGDTEGTRQLPHSVAKNYRKGNNDSRRAVKNKTGTELLTEPKAKEERWKECFEECNTFTENIKLKQTDKFTYLEVLFDDENRQNIDISNRIKNI